MAYKFKRKPFFNPDGDWFIPSEVPFGGELNPKLKPREWFCWLLLNSKNVPEIAWKNLVGVSTTIWRTKNKLKDKGYL